MKKPNIYGQQKWKDDDLRFIMKNSLEMSLTELSIELSIPIARIQHVCNARGFPCFSEVPRSWVKKGYILGKNGYAMYPYKSEFRESASVSNEMLQLESN
tara:strand:- start:99 stop:398 length:300 start_codon:yes stop_codon:yes gene_type:complete